MVRNLLPQATNIADIKITPSAVLHEKSSPRDRRPLKDARCIRAGLAEVSRRNAIKTSECSTNGKKQVVGADRSFVLPFLSSVITGLSLGLTYASGISRQHYARGRSFNLE